MEKRIVCQDDLHEQEAQRNTAEMAEKQTECVQAEEQLQLLEEKLGQNDISNSINTMTLYIPNVCRCIVREIIMHESLIDTCW